MGLRKTLVGLFDGHEDLDLTSGSIVRPLGLLAVPIVITKVVQTVYTLVDTFWLGRYSTTSLAAITLSFPLAFLLLSVSIGLPIAGSIHVAQATGKDDHRTAALVAAQTIVFSLLAASVLGLAAFFLVDDALLILDVTDAVYAEAVAYLRLLSLGLPATVGFVAFLALIRGSGDTITPLPVMVGSIGLNAALDPFLINGWWIAPELGIRGAAYATITARGLAALLGLSLVVGTWCGFDIRPHQFRPRLAWAGRLVRTGVPTSIEQIGRGLSFNLLLVVVGTFSTTVVAGYGIGIRIFSIVVFATGGLSNAVETMTGQNAGAGNSGRVWRTNYVAAVVSFTFLSAIALVCWLAAEPIVRAFSTDPATIDVGVTFLRWLAPTFGFIGVMWTLVGGFRGLGRTAVAAALVLSVLGLVRVPLAWLGGTVLGANGVWIGIAASNVVGGGLALWLFLGPADPGSYLDRSLATGEDGTPEGTGGTDRPTQATE